MTRGNTILLAAIGGAAVAAALTSYLTTEQGKQLLSQAADSLKAIKDKGTALAKKNAGAIVQASTSTFGNVVKQKVDQTTGQTL